MAIIISIIIAFALIASTIFLIVIYNTIVRRKNEIDNAFGSIDVMLKKRHDLIPNLVNAVKVYMAHEKNTLNEIVALRNNASENNLPIEEKVKLENALTKSLGNIMVKVEAYPDLKASENFLQLQQALNEAEDQISASRRFYNSAVTQYNNSIQVFPNNIIAPIFNFDKRAVYESLESERLGPDISVQFSK